MTPAVIGAYAYDGLNRRITRTIGSDDAIHEYYTESWQRIESRPGGESSTQGVSLFVFGIRYIDDIVMRQRDANASGPPEERRYFLTDANYNVSMIVTDAGYGVERIFYTAYGEPEVFPFGDADGDYLVDGTDQTLITAIKNGSQPYNILADLNLDGAVTQTDLNAFSNYSGALGGRGVLTASNGSATTGNDIGYAGYTWNDERSQWHVRHREYDPKLGRWLQRDLVSSQLQTNLYAYGPASPIAGWDPAGADWIPPSLPQSPWFAPPSYRPNIPFKRHNPDDFNPRPDRLPPDMLVDKHCMAKCHDDCWSDYLRQLHWIEHRIRPDYSCPPPSPGFYDWLRQGLWGCLSRCVSKCSYYPIIPTPEEPPSLVVPILEDSDTWSWLLPISDPRHPLHKMMLFYQGSAKCEAMIDGIFGTDPKYDAARNCCLHATTPEITYKCFMLAYAAKVAGIIKDANPWKIPPELY